MKDIHCIAQNAVLFVSLLYKISIVLVYLACIFCNSIDVIIKYFFVINCYVENCFKMYILASNLFPKGNIFNAIIFCGLWRIFKYILLLLWFKSNNIIKIYKIITVFEKQALNVGIKDFLCTYKYVLS